jgi:hypothetical protein
MCAMGATPVDFRLPVDSDQRQGSREDGDVGTGACFVRSRCRGACERLSRRWRGLAVHAHDASAPACREDGRHARRPRRPACLVVYQGCRANSRCSLALFGRLGARFPRALAACVGPRSCVPFRRTRRHPASRFARAHRRTPGGLAREDEFMREIVEMAYLFQQPCILDSSDTERLLGVFASSLDTMIKDTLRAGAIPPV